MAHHYPQNFGGYGGGNPFNQQFGGPSQQQNFRQAMKDTVKDYMNNYMESGYGENMQVIINFPGYDGPARWAPFYEEEERQRQRFMRATLMAQFGQKAFYGAPAPMQQFQNLMRQSLKHDFEPEQGARRRVQNRHNIPTFDRFGGHY